MLDFMLILEVIIAILLSLVILIQNKNVSLNLSSMSSWLWATTKRWPEKILHNITIFLWVIFIVNSVILFVLKSDSIANNNIQIKPDNIEVKSITSSWTNEQNSWTIDNQTNNLETKLNTWEIINSSTWVNN